MDDADVVVVISAENAALEITHVILEKIKVKGIKVTGYNSLHVMPKRNHNLVLFITLFN